MTLGCLKMYRFLELSVLQDIYMVFSDMVITNFSTIYNGVTTRYSLYSIYNYLYYYVGFLYI